MMHNAQPTFTPLIMISICSALNNFASIIPDKILRSMNIMLITKKALKIHDLTICDLIGVI
jgi:hypothetical protein